MEFLINLLIRSRGRPAALVFQTACLSKLAAGSVRLPQGSRRAEARGIANQPQPSPNEFRSRLGFPARGTRHASCGRRKTVATAREKPASAGECTMSLAPNPVGESVRPPQHKTCLSNHDHTEPPRFHMGLESDCDSLHDEAVLKVGRQRSPKKAESANGGRKYTHFQWGVVGAAATEAIACPQWRMAPLFLEITDRDP